jgi:trans-aconitate methyltransferase
LFDPIRLDVKNIVEVGIFDGASLRMWQDYLPNATIHGLDIDQKAVDSAKGDRIKTYLRSGCDASFWQNLDFKPEIILDDGSHIIEEQVDMMNAAWDSLAPGGYYVVEDTHSSFHNVYKKNTSNVNGFYTVLFQRLLDMQSYDTLQGDWYEVRKVFKNRIDKISYETFGIYNFTSVIIFEKCI